MLSQFECIVSEEFLNHLLGFDGVVDPFVFEGFVEP